MARQISPAMRPYVELQRSLPKGTPFSERARAAKELKAQLARRSQEDRPTRRRTRHNPSTPGWVKLALLGGVGLWAYSKMKPQG